MGEGYKCTKEANFSDIMSDISVLKKTAMDNERKIDKLKDESEETHKLNTAISVMSLTLEHIVEYNKKQDARQEKQDEVVAKQNETLISINQNLNELNQGQNHLSKKVASLEDRVETNEEANKISIVDMQKEKYTKYLKDYAVPFGVGTAVATLLLQLFKILIKG